MRKIVRRVTIGMLVLGVASLVANVGWAADPVQTQKKSGTGVKTAPVAAPFTVKVTNFQISGGSKPGDTVTLKMTIQASGNGTKNVPWTIYRDSNIVIKTDTKPNVAAGTTFEVSATWTATAGSHDLYGKVDPQNTLNESSSEQGNNSSGHNSKVFADWATWIAKAKEGAQSGVSNWIANADFKDGVVNAITLTGGKLTGPSFSSAIKNAMTGAGAPSDLATSFAASVWDAWKNWADGWKVGAIPAYPAFAAYPASSAPSMPNVPFPLNPAASGAISGLLPSNLAGSIKSRVGSAKGWPGGDAAIKDFTNWFAGKFAVWSATAIVTNVMGKGPVPSFAPPSVPVGPVVGGSASGNNVLSSSLSF